MVPPKSETLDNCWLGILIKHWTSEYWVALRDWKIHITLPKVNKQHDQVVQQHEDLFISASEFLWS